MTTAKFSRCISLATTWEMVRGDSALNRARIVGNLNRFHSSKRRGNTSVIFSLLYVPIVMLAKYNNNRIGSTITRCKRALSRAMSFACQPPLPLLYWLDFVTLALNGQAKFTKRDTYPVFCIFCYALINDILKKYIMYT